MAAQRAKIAKKMPEAPFNSEVQLEPFPEGDQDNSAHATIQNASRQVSAVPAEVTGLQRVQIR